MVLASELWGGGRRGARGGWRPAIPYLLVDPVQRASALRCASPSGPSPSGLWRALHQAPSTCHGRDGRFRQSGSEILVGPPSRKPRPNAPVRAPRRSGTPAGTCFRLQKRRGHQEKARPAAGGCSRDAAAQESRVAEGASLGNRYRVGSLLGLPSAGKSLGRRSAPRPLTAARRGQESGDEKSPFLPPTTALALIRRGGDPDHDFRASRMLRCRTRALRRTGHDLHAGPSRLAPDGEQQALPLRHTPSRGPPEQAVVTQTSCLQAMQPPHSSLIPDASKTVTRQLREGRARRLAFRLA